MDRRQVALSSGQKTSDTLIYTGDCLLTAVMIQTDGTNNTTAEVYDNTAASGTVVADITVKGANLYGGRAWTFPVKCNNGLYLNITTTGGNVIVEYIPMHAP